MCKVYRVSGSEAVRIHVDAGGMQCECPVVNYGGVAMVLAPQQWQIQQAIRNQPGLLQVVRALMPNVHTLKLSPES